MRLTKEAQETYRARAQQLWAEFTDNERVGVRFGLFPHARMVAVEQEGLWNLHELCVALMDVAQVNGGMRA